MNLVEKHIIDKNHKYFKEIDELSFCSKNLYNYANYIIRQEFIKNGNYLNYNYIQKLLQSHETYKALPAKVSQQILMVLDKNWKSFFNAVKDWQINKNKYLGRPKLPKYKHKVHGRNILIYTIQAISSKYLQDNLISLSKTNIVFFSKVCSEKIQQVRIIPRYSYYVIEIVYEKETPVIKEVGNKLSIDIGLNNLSAVYIDNNKTFLINGRPLKSINQFYNKKKAKLMSNVGDKGSSRKIEKLTLKRNNKVQDYLHKASREVMDIAQANDVCEIIIGHNPNWKQEIELGRRNNQNFVSVPFKSYIDMIQYKAELLGIKTTITEESYTSKVDHLAGESLEKHESYSGRRIKRGLFKSAIGKKINADINGAVGIMRKVVPNVIDKIIKGIEGVVVHPKLVTV